MLERKPAKSTRLFVILMGMGTAPIYNPVEYTQSVYIYMYMYMFLYYRAKVED